MVAGILRRNHSSAKSLPLLERKAGCPAALPLMTLMMSVLCIHAHLEQSRPPRSWRQIHQLLVIPGLCSKPKVGSLWTSGQQWWSSRWLWSQHQQEHSVRGKVQCPHQQCMPRHHQQVCQVADWFFMTLDVCISVTQAVWPIIPSTSLFFLALIWWPMWEHQGAPDANCSHST